MWIYSLCVYLLHNQPLPPPPHLLGSLMAIGADSHRPLALALPFTASLALAWCSLRCSGTDAKLGVTWINSLFIIIHVVWLYTRDTKKRIDNGVCLYTLSSKAMTVNANTGPQMPLPLTLLAVQSQTMPHWFAWHEIAEIDIRHGSFLTSRSSCRSNVCCQ